MDLVWRDTRSRLPRPMPRVQPAAPYGLQSRNEKLYNLLTVDVS